MPPANFPILASIISNRPFVYRALWHNMYHKNWSGLVPGYRAMNKGTVVAAMSGGVDSAVTAALLKQQGYDVIGITLQIWQEHADQGKHGGCCSLGAVEDARRAAAVIGIPHYVLNFREYFAEKVIDKFVAEYRRGRTPNPCVECNRSVKFDELLRHAEDLGADYLATGHYGRIRFNEATGRHELLRAADLEKDQSYALYTLTQRQLSKTKMPLGYLSSKLETRRLATEFGLAVAGKADSQEICFVPKAGYVQFLKQKAPEASAPGAVVDTSGKRIGDHEGIAFYTIGQRKRLPATADGAVFVLSLDADTNTVVVGRDQELYAEGLTADNCIWSSIPDLDTNVEPIDVLAKIRYNGTAAAAQICRGERSGTVAARFVHPQRAVTPGQSAVFYGGDGDEAGNVVLGGGVIERAIPRMPDREI